MNAGALVTFSAYARAMVDGSELPTIFQAEEGGALTPYQVLRALTPVAELRRNGTFFTSTELALEAWASSLPQLANGAVVVDPACGAGDLLMPVAEHATANALTNVAIRGGDLDPEFAKVAGARIGASAPHLTNELEFVARDFLADQTMVKDASHVVLNPPFVPMQVDTDWASGSINAAAWFVISALESMQPGGRLLAVLPDVLRSGSRYTAWRKRVCELAQLDRVKPLGLFDHQTDVHVFVLDAVVGGQARSEVWFPDKGTDGTVGDRFKIRVGPVVPHRHPEVGDLVRFLTARSLRSDEVVERRFRGRLERGPMVLVNRTSRPGQEPRVRGRVWSDREPVAIENHLLVLKPRDGLVRTCRELVDLLVTEPTVDYLDNRIRCRHLTVEAVEGIPWSSRDD